MMRRNFAPLLLAFVVGSGLIIPTTIPSAIPTAVSLTSEIEAEAAAKKKETRKERKARLNPQISPPPNWPPKGFTMSNGIYAKIPTKRTVTGPKTSDTATITSYGSLTTKSSGSDARAQKVILLISSEPIAERVRVANINVTCHRSGKKGKSGNTYLPFEDRG